MARQVMIWSLHLHCGRVVAGSRDGKRAGAISRPREGLTRGARKLHPGSYVAVGARLRRMLVQQQRKNSAGFPEETAYEPSAPMPHGYHLEVASNDRSQEVYLRPAAP